MESHPGDVLSNQRMPGISHKVIEGETRIRDELYMRRDTLILLIGKVLREDPRTVAVLYDLFPDMPTNKCRSFVRLVGTMKPSDTLIALTTWPENLAAVEPGYTKDIKAAELGPASFRQILTTDSAYQDLCANLPPNEKLVHPVVEMTYPFLVTQLWRVGIADAEKPLRGVMHHTGYIAIKRTQEDSGAVPDFHSRAGVVTTLEWEDKTRAYLMRKYQDEEDGKKHAWRLEATAMAHAVRAPVGAGKRG